MYVNVVRMYTHKWKFNKNLISNTQHSIIYKANIAY